jgi:two-component system sensor histidine kinase/response regulator
MSAFFDTLSRTFSSDGFVPRRICGLWPDWLVWEHIAGNASVWLAYVAVPLLIWRLGVGRPDWSPFRGVIRSFALFIGLCGLGHFLDMLAFFHPMYRLSGHLLVLTGLVSFWTVWSIRGAWPAFSALKSPAELERVILERTAELTRSIDELERAEVARACLATLVESSRDAIVGKDLDGVITSWNSGAERIFGYTAAEAVGRPITLIVPSDRRDEEKAILEQIRLGETVDHHESVRLTRDGRSIDVSLTISPIKVRSGRIVGISKIARDITDQKQTRESLRRSEERQRRALSAARIGHWEWEFEADRVTYHGGLKALYGRPN